MIRLIALIVAFCSLSMSQVQSKSGGTCSPIISGGVNNKYTFYCDGLSAAQGKQLLEIMNRVAKDQLDPVAVMNALDEIKALATRGSTSPEAVAQGIQIYASGRELSSKAIAQTVYENLTDFLDRQRRNSLRLIEQHDALTEQAKSGQEQVRATSAALADAVAASRSEMSARNAALPAAYDHQAVDAYHTVGYYRIVSNNLESLRAQNAPVASLVMLNENLKTLDDIQKLANEIRQFPDPRSQTTSAELANFVDGRKRLAQRGQVSGSPTPSISLPTRPSIPIPSFQVPPLLDLDQRTVDLYHAAQARSVSAALTELKSRNVKVENLISINDGVSSVDDLRKLTVGLKALADTLLDQ